MATIDVHGPTGELVDQRELPAGLFDGPVNAAVMHQVVVAGMAAPRIRIKLRGYDHEILDAAARDIVDHVTRTGAKVVGPVPLPTERNLWTVIRSPHKDKDSREHFQMLTHKRLIDILDATSKTVQELQRLNLSAGVDIEIKL